MFGGLTWSILKTQSLAIVAPHMPALTVKRIGAALMTSYVWPLQCVGLLLTAALIGALILVMEENSEKMKQTLNAQRSTPTLNSDVTLDVGRWR